MTLWLDAQLPSQLANWIQQSFAINSVALRDIGLRDATDLLIFCGVNNQGQTTFCSENAQGIS